MPLTGILSVLDQHPLFLQHLKGIAGSPSATPISLRQGARPAFIGALRQRRNRPMLVISPRPEDARRLHDQLLTYLGETQALHLLPEPEVLPFERLAVDAGTSNQRLAALAALAIISAYIETVAHHVPDFTLEINDPTVLAGMFLGGIFPFLVSSMTMTAVGDAAFEMIHEIRRQFKEIPGLMEGTAEPDSNRCIEIATTAALKRMIAPGVLAVSGPVVVGFLLGPEALGGMLGGALLGCVLLALTMANAGGAWDNAKKFVEKGNLGGKGSEVHKAVVVGDTVGDPFKDTSGPSMNILINVMAIVSLVIAPLLG